MHPGIAQLAGRLLWEQEVARSNRATRTKPIAVGNTRNKIEIAGALRLMAARHQAITTKGEGNEQQGEEPHGQGGTNRRSPRS